MYSTAEVYQLVEQMAPQFGVDPATAKIIIGAEQVHKGEGGGWKIPANYSPRPSPVGAQGVGQVMPKTKAALVKQGHLSSEYASDAGLKGQIAASLAAIKEMLPRTGNDPLRIAAAYNGGTRAGKLYGTDQFSQAPAETQQHVQKAKFVMDQLFPDQSNAETQRLQRGTSTAQQSGVTSLGSSMIQQLQQAMGVASTSTDNAIQSLFNYQNTADTGMRAAQQAAVESAEGANMMAAGTVQAAEIQQARKDQLTQMFSLTDADVQANRDRYSQIEGQRQQLEAQVHEQLAVGFFDNPIQYLANLTTLPGLVNQHNALASKTEQLNKEISQRQSHSANQQQVTAANQLEAIKTQEQGKAMETVAKANAELSKLEVENAGTNAKNMLTILSAETGRLEAQSRLVQITRQELEQQASFREKAKAEQDQIVETKAVNSMLAPIGGAIDEKTWKEMPASAKMPLRQMITRGNYGNSLAEAYEVITGSGLYNRSRATPSLVVTIDSLTEQVSARARQIEAKDALKKGKPQEYRAQALATIEQEWMEAARKGTDRERLPMGNPFSLDFNALHLSGQWKDSWIGKVMATRARDNMVGGATGLTFNDFTAEALASISAKKLTPAKAAEDLARFYNDADSMNYEKRGLALFHVPKADTYTVFAGPAQRELNAKNAAQVEQFLTLRSQSMLQQEINYQLFRDHLAPNVPATGNYNDSEMIMGPRGPAPRPMRKN